MVKKKGGKKGKGATPLDAGSSSPAEKEPETPPPAQVDEPAPQGSVVSPGQDVGKGRGQGRNKGRDRGGGEPFNAGRGDGRGRGRGEPMVGPGGDTRHPAAEQEQVNIPAQVQQPSPEQPTGAVKKERRGPSQGSPSAAVGVAAGPTPSEGPQRFQATPASPVSPQPQPTSPVDQKLISMKKGLADMSISDDKAKQAGHQVGSLQIPHRKSYSVCGTSGRKTKVLTNHLSIDLTSLSKMTVIHYDVIIDPDKPKRLMRLAVRAAKEILFKNRYPAFDGKKNLYSAGQLPFGREVQVDVKVWDDERDRQKDYKVTFKQVAQIDMKSLSNYMSLAQNKAPRPVPQNAIQALDIILRSAPAHKMVQVGRSFFSPPVGRALSLGNGMEVWHGVFQSAIIGWKPFLNIDVAHKGFPKPQWCMDLLQELTTNRNGVNVNEELGMYDKDGLMRFIRELKVNYEIPNNPTSKRTYRVNGIGKSARMQRFTMDDGTEMSVEEYYGKMKKIRLKFPHMPVLDVGSPTRSKKIYVPLELCTIKEGQVTIKKLNENQTAEMIKVAATPSDDRKRKIMDALRTIDFKSDPCVDSEFKVKVAKEFEVVESRVLDPPKLMYAQNKEVLPVKGVWFQQQFFEGKALSRWTILNLSRMIQDQDLRMFADQIMTNGKRAGMNIAHPHDPFQSIQLGRRVMDDLNKLEAQFTKYKQLNMELVFCVVEEKGDAYAQVKRMAELKIGVLTQCVKAVTIQRRMRSPATANNILMKVNSKLNGKNHCFTPVSRPRILDRPVIILGADVTHPPPDQTNTPSVAAVCASHDPKAFQYNLQWRLQPPRVEIIEDLENIMKEHLRFFFRKTNQKPQRIIFYRDGVSEGQFNDVLNNEFMAIRRACKSLHETYEPGITFLVVQKRHHTRFFPDPNSKNPNDFDGRNNNVPAGTIVDTMITHPTDMDFYLVSHASIQGVSRPTKYRRLWDDNNIPEDELELLTYYLCHLFSRCTRSVSYPAPTYYAHLAAYRVRCYMEMGQVSLTNLAQEQAARQIQECIVKEFPMFFV